MPWFPFKLPGGKAVDVADTPNDGDVVTYDAASDKYKASPPSGSSVTYAALAAAGLFTTVGLWVAAQIFIAPLALESGQINYTNHIIQMPANSGTVCLTNQTGTCGADRTTNQTAQKDYQMIGYNNVTRVWTLNQFSVNNISQSCGAGNHLSTLSLDNATGFLSASCTADTGGSGISAVQNLNSGINLVATNSSNKANIKPLVCSSGVSCVNNTSNIAITSTLTQGYTKLNNLDGGTASILATNTTLSSTQATAKTLTQGTGITITNGTKTLTITNAGVTSIAGTALNITISASSGSVTANLGNNVVMTQGSDQTITKKLSLTAKPGLDIGNDNGLVIRYDGLTIRNKAGTFATTLNNTDIIANRTLNLPKITQTETLSIVPSRNQSTYCASGCTATNPTGTTSTTGVMAGLRAQMQPKVNGIMLIMVSGAMKNTVSGSGIATDLRYGLQTSSYPSNAAALTGTVCSVGLIEARKITATITSEPFTLICTATGLSPGSKYWIDLQERALVSGTASIQNMTVTTFELG